MKKRTDFFNSGENEKLINWKSVNLLKRYTTRFGDIKKRKYTGNSVKHQKQIKKAITRARELALLPYIK